MFRTNYTAERATIFLYSSIGLRGDEGTLTAKEFASDLAKLRGAKEITLRINSEGGSVVDARAMANLLRQHPARKVAVIDSLAASASTYLVCACDRVEIAADAIYMVHSPESGVFGSAKILRQEAIVLDLIEAQIIDLYTGFTGQPRAKVAEWVAAESWMDAQTAVQRGFAHEVISRKSVAPPATLARMNFRNTPRHLLRSPIKFVPETSKLARMQNIVTAMKMKLEHGKLRDRMARMKQK